MKTTRKTESDRGMKSLFQQLFILQNEYEKTINRYDLKGLKVISLIDELMEVILEDHND